MKFNVGDRVVALQASGKHKVGTVVEIITDNEGYDYEVEIDGIIDFMQQFVDFGIIERTSTPFWEYELVPFK